MKQAVFNWSGGKDSSLALYKIIQAGNYHIHRLLTSFNETYGRVSIHGVRKSLMQKQASLIGIPMHCLMLPEQIAMEDYDRLMVETMNALKREGVKHALFGDIFLDDIRAYREQQLEKVAMKAVFPLWGASTTVLAREFIDAGFKAIVTAVDSHKLSADFVGRPYDRQFLGDLPDDVDPCGEFGAFHTFVHDGPIFKASVPFRKGEMVERTYPPAESNQDNDNDSSASADKASKSHLYFFIDLLP